MMFFVDTSAIIAFLDADDEFHSRAEEIFSGSIKESSQLITSNYIMLETIIILKNRFGLEAVSSFNEDFVPSLKIYWINERIHNTGVNNLVIAKRKKISLVDFTSFEIMKKLGIKKAFSFDRHYNDFGFETV